jgi:FAD binding domain
MRFAYPRDESEIGALLDWCGENDLAAIPFGGGSSVVGGVNPPADAGYPGTGTIDLKLLNRVLEVDGASQAARVQGHGPDPERQLKPTGLPLRGHDAPGRLERDARQLNLKAIPPRTVWVCSLTLLTTSSTVCGKVKNV